MVKTQPTKDTLMKALTSYITTQLEKVFDEERDKLVASFEAERDRIIASAALRVSNYMSVQDLGHELRIIVQKVAPTNKEQD